MACLGLAVHRLGGLADFFAPAPDCSYDRTLRAVWRRRPLGKVILRDLAATAGGLSSYRSPNAIKSRRSGCCENCFDVRAFVPKAIVTDKLRAAENFMRKYDI